MYSEAKLRLTAERIRRLLRYAPETGLFYWRVSRGSVAAESPAGSAQANRYVVIRIHGALHYAHRLAWLYVHGEFPPGEIDHANRDPTDNRIANLRVCSRRQNAQNRVRNSSSGFKGVERRGRKWRARIIVDGVNMIIGSYSTGEEAAAAYDDAARLHYGEFARTNEMMGLLPPRSVVARYGSLR